MPSVHELLIGRLASLSIDDVPLIEVARDPREELAFTIKTGLDYVLATALILFAAPVCAVAALAIRLTSPGPIFYRQRRVGQAGSEFMMYKLRTMRDGAEEETGPVLAYHGDARVTAAGRFLRATRIDEIPQLLNVLNGTMSLIGPRPERPEFVEGLVREIPATPNAVGEAGSLGARAGARGVRHVGGVQAEVRPGLHPQLLVAARHPDHGGNREGSPHPPGNLAESSSSLPRSARRGSFG